MTLSFDRDIRPLFREQDRNAMRRHFDLWSIDDVRANSPQILDVLERGRMPCDSSWQQDQIDTLRSWIDSGMAP